MFRKKDGSTNMTALVLTVAVAAMVLMVGLTILANTETTIGDMTKGINGNSTNATCVGQPVGTSGADCLVVAFGDTAMSGSFTTVLENTGTSADFLALGLFVMASVFIVGIVAGVLGRSN